MLDLVGQVPEDQLRGSILVFDEAGVTRYLRGERNGDKVTIEVSMSSYENPCYTEFTCLGRRPLFDEWPVHRAALADARLLRRSRTSRTMCCTAFWHFPAEQAEPIRGSRPVRRPGGTLR